MDGEGRIVAYVLVKDGATRDVLDNLLRLAPDEASPIRYAGVLTGSADAIAAVEVESFQELEALLDGVFRPIPTVTTSTAIGLRRPQGPLMPKITPCNQEIEAFVFAWVKPGRAEDVVRDLLALDGIEEAGMVAGDFDVLTVICAATLDDVMGRLLDQIHHTPSIVRTSTAFVLRSARAPQPQQP